MKLEEARGAAAAAEAATVQRAQEASEQALLYVVGKYWLRQKLHFPTVASCVRGLVSLSLVRRGKLDPGLKAPWLESTLA